MIRILLFASLLIAPPPSPEGMSAQDPDEEKGQFLSLTWEFDVDMVRTMRTMQEHIQVVSRKTEKEVVESLKKNGFSLIHGVLTPRESGGRAYVAMYKDFLVIAFRGTKSASTKELVSNIISDLDVRRKKMEWLSGEAKDVDNYREIRVHRGFAKEYLRFRGDVFKAVDENRGKPIFVFGHSLGAALATLCAFDIRVSRDRDVHVYISGSPRVGGDEFREAFEKEIKVCVRITVGDDPFPRIPPRRMGYAHAGRLLALERDGTRIPTDKIRANMVVGTFSDHNNRFYREVVQKFLDRCRKDPEQFEEKRALRKAADAERVSKE